jgi:DNA-binding YbaB/EbfC family protein
MSGSDDTGNPTVLRDLMQAAQKMQSEVARVTEELSRRVIEGESGGGLVRCTVSGAGDVLSVTIDPAVASMSGGDPAAARKMIEDLTVAAVNAALERARQAARTEMGRVTGGVGLPPGMFGS